MILEQLMSDRAEPRGGSARPGAALAQIARLVREPPRSMRRSPFMLILLLLLGAIAVGLLGLGAFPPAVEPRSVERTLPNERFSTGR